MRTGEAIVNYGILLGPMLVGISVSVLMSFVYNWPLSSAFILALSFFSSASLLTYAKMPNLKSGRVFTFGISSIEPDRKKYYVLAYVCLFLGFVVSMAFVLASRY